MDDQDLRAPVFILTNPDGQILTVEQTAHNARFVVLPIFSQRQKAHTFLTSCRAHNALVQERPLVWVHSYCESRGLRYAVDAS